MRGGHRLLAVTGMAILMGLGGATAQADTPGADLAMQSLAQAPPAEKPSMTTRIKTWTRAKLDAAKTHWAEDKAKFEECQQKLLDERKTRRMSIYKQGDFLERCMTKKQ